MAEALNLNLPLILSLSLILSLTLTLTLPLILTPSLTLTLGLSLTLPLAPSAPCHRRPRLIAELQGSKSKSVSKSGRPRHDIEAREARRPRSVHRMSRVGLRPGI
ncbi:MAG: hypothetical protein SYC29_13345 [Planctomycetota bacterium]|nr:hypothetical protein [Planctomycetota bacterium]